MCSMWLSTAQEKTRLPNVLMGKNTRFAHLQGVLGIQILDYSFRSPVVNMRGHVMSPYQKHRLRGMRKKKLKVEPSRRRKDDPESPACKSDMLVDVESTENAVFNQSNAN